MADLTKQNLELDLIDKLYHNLVETGKIVRRLFITFFTLMIVLSALAFEPQMFSDAKSLVTTPRNLSESVNSPPLDAQKESPNKVMNTDDIAEPSVPFFGFRITRGTLLKYSSLVLTIMYLMLATYLIYLDLLKEEFRESYSALYTTIGENRSSLIERIRFPAFHFIVSDLAIHHSSKFVQFLFQGMNLIKSLILYVLPMFIVIMLLGEGIKRASSKTLITIFYLSPILIIIGTLTLTRQWFIETGKVLSGFINSIIEFVQITASRIFAKLPAGAPASAGKEKRPRIFAKLSNYASLVGAIATIVVTVISAGKFFIASRDIPKLTSEPTRRLNISKLEYEMLLSFSNRLPDSVKSLNDIDYDKISAPKIPILLPLSESYNFDDESGSPNFVQVLTSKNRRIIFHTKLVEVGKDRVKVDFQVMEYKNGRLVRASEAGNSAKWKEFIAFDAPMR